MKPPTTPHERPFTKYLLSLTGGIKVELRAAAKPIMSSNRPNARIIGYVENDGTFSINLPITGAIVGPSLWSGSFRSSRQDEVQSVLEALKAHPHDKVRLVAALRDMRERVNIMAIDANQTLGFETKTF